LGPPSPPHCASLGKKFLLNPSSLQGMFFFGPTFSLGNIVSPNHNLSLTPSPPRPLSIRREKLLPRPTFSPGNVVSPNHISLAPSPLWRLSILRDTSFP
jgi:hypothetical protein